MLFWYGVYKKLHMTDIQDVNIRCKKKSMTVVWLFNGTSTQKGQFVPTVGKGID